MKKWPEIKEDVINSLKAGSCAVILTMGFWVIYGVVWLLLGLPETNWALWMLLAFAVVSEYFYVRWM